MSGARHVEGPVVLLRASRQLEAAAVGHFTPIAWAFYIPVNRSGYPVCDDAQLETSAPLSPRAEAERLRAELTWAPKGGAA